MQQDKPVTPPTMLFSEASNGHMLAEVLAEGSSSAASSARGTLRGIAMLVTPTAKLATGYTDQARLIIAAFVIVLVSELIGIVNVPVGPGKIVLLPMLWALLIGAVWSVAGDRLPAPLQIGTALQRRAAAIVQIGVLIFVAKLGLMLGAVSGFATLVWAPTGISLAALLLFGGRLSPGVFLGAFAVNLWTGAPVLVALGIATGNTLEALVGAALIRRMIGVPHSFERGEDVVKFFAVAVVCPVLAATIALIPLSVGHASLAA